MPKLHLPFKVIQDEPFHVTAERFYCSPDVAHLTAIAQIGSPSSVVRRIHATVIHMAAQLSSLSTRSLASCLDVGCNGGELTRLLAPYFPQTVGVDLSPHLIESASKRYPEISFRVADARKLDFARASYDVVVCSALIHYLPEWQMILSECSRVVKPDGFLLIEFARSIHPAQRLLRGLAATLLGKRRWAKTGEQFKQYVEWKGWYPGFRNYPKNPRQIDEVTSFLSSIHMRPIELHLPRRFPSLPEDQIGIIAQHGHAECHYDLRMCNRCLDGI